MHAHPEILRLEQDLRAAKQRLTDALRALPLEPVQNYSLRHVPSGSPVTLAQLFGASRDLLVIHNMGTRCPYCTLWADGFASLYKHLASRCGFVLTTPDEPGLAGAFASVRGWTFPVVSHAGTTFAQDLGYRAEKDGTYGRFLPGVSAFRLREDGSIVRTGTRSFGPGDDFCAVWPMFDMLEGGPGEWAPTFHGEQR
jgi:predicted dithiol-disulfide oxidoreductase (DUF899 family)